jgi:hypothetical protein
MIAISSARHAALLLLAASFLQSAPARGASDNVALLYFWGGPLYPIRHESGKTVLVVGTQDVPFRICFTEPINKGCAPGYTQTGFSAIDGRECDVITPYCECLYWVFAGKSQPSTVVSANDNQVLGSAGCVDFVLVTPPASAGGRPPSGQDLNTTRIVDVEFYWQVAHGDRQILPPGLIGPVTARANELAPVMGMSPQQWIEWITPEICDLITKDMPPTIRLLATPAHTVDQCSRTHTIRFERILVDAEASPNYLAKMPYHAISIGGILVGAFIFTCSIVYHFT